MVHGAPCHSGRIMIVVFEAILPVFAIVMLGFGLRKMAFVPADHWRIIEELCFWVLFPAILAKTLILSDFSGVRLGPFVYTLLASIAAIALIVLASWPLMRRFWATGPGQFSTIFQTSTRWHGFIALAIVLELFGTDGGGLIAVAFALMVPVLQVSNILVLAAFTPGNRPPATQIARTVIINPIIIGITAGLVINLAGVPVWPPVMAVLDLLGRAALGLSLLALGAGLSLQAALRPSRELVAGVLGKLVLTPAVTAGFAIWFGVSGMAFSVLMVSACVPTAINGYLLARKMGGDAELYAATSTVQTMLSFAVIPLVLWLGRTWGGGL